MFERARRAKEGELYVMTPSASGSGASAEGSRNSRIDGGAYGAYGEGSHSDGTSAIHSLDTHPQYRGFKGVYYNPVVQVFFLGFVCFMGPGLFNALTGLGGGGAAGLDDELERQLGALRDVCGRRLLRRVSLS